MDLDKLWQDRAKKGSAEKLLKALDDGLAKKPDDYDLLWQRARLGWWLAENSERGPEKTKAADAGLTAGRQATKVKADGVEGRFWVVAALGEYAKGISIVKALLEGLDGDWRKHCGRAIELDETFEGGGPHRAMGRYYFSLPWPKRDLKKSLEHLEKAVKLGPKRVMNQLFLADTLAALGRKDEARKQLEAIRKQKSDDPAEKPDAGRYREAAERLARELG